MSTKEAVETYDNHTEAFSALNDLSEKGDPCAQSHVAYMYAHGLGAPQWYSQAVHWWRKAATQGRADAQFSLAESYVFGIGVSQSYRDAVKWYLRAAKQDHVAALYRLGASYRDGKGVDGDAIEAERLFLKAANKGYAFAQNDLGAMYGRDGRYDDAAHWYRRAADQGNPTAQFNLAYCYLEGRGVLQDADKATALFNKAARQGLGAAQNDLGRLYETGELGFKDIHKAMELFRKPADAGEAISQFNLGRLYAQGVSGSENDLYAAELFRSAAAQGHQKAQEELWNIFDRGAIEPIDDAEAAEWHRRNALQGDVAAQLSLAIDYTHGRGLQRDQVEAIKWYTESAKQGNARAQYHLAKIYSDGNWVDKDDSEAVGWFSASASQGDIDAQYELGFRYANGIGVAEDDFRAVHWYTRSAQQGNADAQYELGNHFARGEGVAQNQTEAQSFYLRAADGGNGLAMKQLGIRYFEGAYVPRDYVAAASFFERYVDESARSGQSGGEFPTIGVRLGHMYLNGQGVSRNSRKAFDLFRQAASYNDSDGQFQLGMMYLESRVGKDLLRSTDKHPSTRQWCSNLIRAQWWQVASQCIARSWFLRAANQGHTEAQIELAGMLENGEGGIGSLVQAHKWYNLAGDSEHRDRIGSKLDAKGLHEAQRLAGEWTVETVAPPTGPSKGPIAAGTGFWVSESLILTNYHVVVNCQQVSVSSAGSAVLVDADEDADLALLSVPPQAQPPTMIANFPTKWEVELGDEVTVAGFPEYRKRGAVVTRGHVTAILEGDETRIQINAEMHSGNSGGPVLDAAGNVIAVAVARLDERVYIGRANLMPQLVNYAVSPVALRRFLSKYTHQIRTSARSTRSVAEDAKDLIVHVQCQ